MYIADCSTRRRAYTRAAASSDPSELELLQHLDDLVVARSDPDPKRHRRATRLAVVLPEVDRLARDLAHVECPEHARDGEPDLALGDDLPGADAAAVDGAVSEHLRAWQRGEGRGRRG